MSYDANGVLDTKHGYECPECGCKDNIHFSMRARDRVQLRCGNCNKRFNVTDAERKIHARISNADAIRAMNDETLAKFIEIELLKYPWCSVDAPVDPVTKECLVPHQFCWECALDWLKSEAEDI